MYTYLGKWIMVNNSKCECPFLPAHPWKSIPLQITMAGSLLGCLPWAFRGLGQRALRQVRHSGLALPGPCPAEIMYHLLGLRPVLKGPRPHNTALWLPPDGHGLSAVTA